MPPMKTSQITSNDWQKKLNQISQKLENRNVNIEVIGMDVGDQFEAKSVHLKGLCYDPRSDVVELYSDNFEHTIPHPSQIYFTSENDVIESIQSIEFVESNTRKQIVTFDAPLLLKND